MKIPRILSRLCLVPLLAACDQKPTQPLADVANGTFSASVSGDMEASFSGAAIYIPAERGMILAFLTPDGEDGLKGVTLLGGVDPDSAGTGRYGVIDLTSDAADPEARLLAMYLDTRGVGDTAEVEVVYAPAGGTLRLDEVDSLRLAGGLDFRGHEMNLADTTGTKPWTGEEAMFSLRFRAAPCDETPLAALCAENGGPQAIAPRLPER